MSKFKVGERVRIVSVDPNSPLQGLRGQEAIVTALPGWGCRCEGAIHSQCYKLSTVSGYWFCGSEQRLRKLLPDSDTYHPANISIDDLMRGLKGRETA